MAKKKKKTASKLLRSPKRDAELFVTKRLLDLTKSELNSNIASLRMEMKAGFSKMDARFTEVDSEFAAIRSELSEVKSTLASLDAKFDKMLVIVEEQNVRNKVVLDSYGLVYDKLNNHDERLKKVETQVLGIEQE